MPMPNQRVTTNALLQSVLQRITPTPAELKLEKKTAAELISKIKKINGKHLSVQLLGSLARNTHLAGDRDLDLFVFFPKKLSRAKFEREGLRIGKKVLKGHFWEEAYSEHPYIRGVYNGFEVEIVPTYRIKGTHEKQSSVDRTPFHNQYLKKKLKKNQEKHVRLLKRFLKGINAYGADTHYNSLSGYAVELLIIHYQTFSNAIAAMAQWKPPIFIDLEKQWKKKDALSRFNQSPLVLIDPTDSTRNVAAALSNEQLGHIVSQCKRFQKKPSIEFFFPKPVPQLSIPKIKQHFRQKHVIALESHYPSGIIADIVWGQAHRIARQLEQFLEKNGFSVKHITTQSDEKTVLIWFVELRHMRLPPTQIRTGPFANDYENVQRFLRAHRGHRYQIKKNRVIIQIPRSLQTARQAITAFIQTLSSNQTGLNGQLFKQNQIIDRTNITKLSKNKVLINFASQFFHERK